MTQIFTQLLACTGDRSGLESLEARQQFEAILLAADVRRCRAPCEELLTLATYWGIGDTSGYLTRSWERRM